MMIWRRMRATLPCTSDIGVENTATRLTVPSSRIGTAACPSSVSSKDSTARAGRFVRAACSATRKPRSLICTSDVESEKIASCRPSVP